MHLIAKQDTPLVKEHPVSGVAVAWVAAVTGRRCF